MPDRQQLRAVLSDLPVLPYLPVLPVPSEDQPAPAPRTLQETLDGDRVQVRLGADGSGRGSFAEFQRVTSSDPL